MSSSNPRQAVKATPKRARPASSSLAPPSSASSAPSVGTPAKSKRPKLDSVEQEDGEGGDEGKLWSAEIDQALFSALREIPNIGRRKVTIDGHSLGRNGLVSEYILRRTGKSRNRGQVGSHIQVLKKHHAKDAELTALFETPPIPGTDMDSIAQYNWDTILGPRHASTLAAIAAAGTAVAVDPRVYLTTQGLLEREIVVDVDSPRASRRQGTSSVGGSGGEETPKKEQAKKGRTPRKSSGLAPAPSSSGVTADGVETPVKRGRGRPRKSVAVPPPLPASTSGKPVLVVQGSRKPAAAVEGEVMEVDAKEQGKEELVVGEEVVFAEAVTVEEGAGERQVVQLPVEDVPEGEGAQGWLGRATGAFWRVVGY